MLLDAGVQPEAPQKPVPEPVLQSHPKDLVQEAYQRAYHPSIKFKQQDHLDKGNQDVGDRYHLVGEAGSTRGTRNGSTITGSIKTRQALSSSLGESHQYPTLIPSSSGDHTLTLPGLGAGRQRDGFGRALNGGQETGQGVIGGSVTSIVSSRTTPASVVIYSDRGCDLPMIRPTSPDDDQVVHRVSLDPDLPPLAVEHPARVWNSMLHSLSENLQPTIRWDYEKTFKEDGGETYSLRPYTADISAETKWIAHLTLILPPSHPALITHPLHHTLPTNKYDKAYLPVVEVLGGVKKWTGIPKRLKVSTPPSTHLDQLKLLQADAQNTTLMRCIAEDAFSWLYDPVLAILPDVEDEGEDINDEEWEQAQRELGGIIAQWAEGVEPEQEAADFGEYHIRAAVLRIERYARYCLLIAVRYLGTLHAASAPQCSESVSAIEHAIPPTMFGLTQDDPAVQWVEARSVDDQKHPRTQSELQQSGSTVMTDIMPSAQFIISQAMGRLTSEIVTTAPTHTTSIDKTSNSKCTYDND
jgi:hypothetical protein